MAASVVLLGIACSRPRLAIVTVPVAKQLAERNAEKDIVVAGYYIFHAEGETLEVQPGDQTLDGLFVSLRPLLQSKKNGEALASRKLLATRYDQKFVHVHGILKNGPFLAHLGVQSDHPYLEAHEVKDASHGSSMTP